MGTKIKNELQKEISAIKKYPILNQGNSKFLNWTTPGKSQSSKCSTGSSTKPKPCEFYPYSICIFDQSIDIKTKDAIMPPIS
jgi:hypothetical protein